jgi:hypothetical protein
VAVVLWADVLHLVDGATLWAALDWALAGHLGLKVSGLLTERKSFAEVWRRGARRNHMCDRYRQPLGNGNSYKAIATERERCLRTVNQVVI